MKKVFYVFTLAITVSIFSVIYSCNKACTNDIYLETLKMDFEVNSSNLGLLTTDIKNSGDTIKSHKNQFYNEPEFRRFGKAKIEIPNFFISTAYASEPCLEREEFVSRMDLTKTTFSLNVDYDGTADGIGIIPADSNLLSISILRTKYFQDFDDNVALAFGANGPLTIDPDFFTPINGQWVTFSFYFEEKNGNPFFDDAIGYINVQ